MAEAGTAGASRETTAGTPVAAGPAGPVPLPDPLPDVDLAGVRKALTRYRAMAWIVGIMLLALTCVAMPLKYLAGQPEWVTWIGIVHGWLYAALLVAAYDLGRRVQWPLVKLLIIALAGTIPFATFFAEWWATRDVRRTLTASERARAGAPIAP